jgi:multiple sugar transport system permease protein
MNPVTATWERTSLLSRLKTRWGELWEDIKRNRVFYLFIAPFGIIFLIFTVIPVITSMILSFTYFNILEPPEWIGFGNYIKLFVSDDIFLLAVKNTFLFAAITGPISYMMCFIFAWLINELPPKIRAFMTLIFYAPSISGQVFMIWKMLFSGDAYGYINGLLLKFGIIVEPRLWLTDPKYMMPVTIIVILWISLGTSFLAFIAGLQGVNRELYDAGAVDGVKNRWQELWYITLPSMKNMLMFGAVMSITGSFGIGSVITALVGFPSTDYAVHTVVHHLEDYGGIRFEMGYASAIATILFIIMVSCNKIIQKLLSKVGE